MPEITDGVEERYEFANGWAIVVHEVRSGKVFFQRFPPGVDRQSFIANLSRMPISQFLEAVHQQRIAEAKA